MRRKGRPRHRRKSGQQSRWSRSISVPSIIDVTSTVGCYLSGLTDRNTIPTRDGAQHAHTHSRGRIRSHVWLQLIKTTHFTKRPERNLLVRLWGVREWRTFAPAEASVSSPPSHADALMSLMTSFKQMCCTPTFSSASLPPFSRLCDDSSHGRVPFLVFIHTHTHRHFVDTRAFESLLEPPGQIPSLTHTHQHQVSSEPERASVVECGGSSVWQDTTGTRSRSVHIRQHRQRVVLPRCVTSEHRHRRAAALASSPRVLPARAEALSQSKHHWLFTGRAVFLESTRE